MHSYAPDRISPCFANYGTICEICKRLLQASESMLPAIDECLLRMHRWLSSSAKLYSMRRLAKALSRPAHIKLKYGKQAHNKQCVPDHP